MPSISRANVEIDMASLTAAAYQPVGSEEERSQLIEFCDRVVQENNKELLNQLSVPIRSGRAWLVPAGHTCRIIANEGPQVEGHTCTRMLHARNLALSAKLQNHTLQLS